MDSKKKILSERKGYEEALRNAQDVLEQRVAERTADLESANEQLQREVSECRQTEKMLCKSEKSLTEPMNSFHTQSKLEQVDYQKKI